MKTKLSIRERADTKRSSRRQELITTVRRGFDESADALQELKDDEHWKDTHTSWIEFCKETFAISKTKLFNIFKYTEIVGTLSKENQSKIINIEQALALAKVLPKDRDKVISKAENNGGITADNLRFHYAKKVTRSGISSTSQ